MNMVLSYVYWYSSPLRDFQLLASYLQIANLHLILYLIAFLIIFLCDFSHLLWLFFLEQILRLFSEAGELQAAYRVLACMSV